MGPDPIRIVYRTKTDRLILAGAPLPACSMATLQIESPHPHLKVNSAIARLYVVPCSVDADLSPNDLASAFAQATWSDESEIPSWQIEAVAAELASVHFFRRAKILNPKAFLSVHSQAGKLGRPYREVPELDAIVVQLAGADSAIEARQSRPDLARLPHPAGR